MSEDNEFMRLLGLACDALDQEDPFEAIDHAMGALKLAREGGRRDLEAGSVMILIRAFMLADRYHEVPQFLSLGLEAAADAEYEEATAYLKQVEEMLTEDLVELGESFWTAQTMLENQQMEEAVPLLERARELASLQGRELIEASSSALLGQVLFAMGRAEEAVVAIQRGIELAEDNGDQEMVDELRGFLHFAQGGKIEGMEGPSLWIAQGEQALRLGRPEEAIEPLEKARAGFLEQSVEEGAVVSTLRLFQALLRIEKEREAIQLIKETMTALGDPRDPSDPAALRAFVQEVSEKFQLG